MNPYASFLGANYLLQALHAGMASMVLTNASPAMPIWGGRTPFLGTSPLGIAVPGGDLQPLVLDMATAVAARGKIRRAAERGESIPEGWALDEGGRPDHRRCCGLPRHSAAVGRTQRVGPFPHDGSAGRCHVGSGFRWRRKKSVSWISPRLRTSAISSLCSGPTFSSRARNTAREWTNSSWRAKACPLAEGFDEILMPGERESRLAESRRKLGVPITAEDFDMLFKEEALAKELSARET